MPATSDNRPRFERRDDHFGTWVRNARESAYERACRAGRSEPDAADISQEVAEYALNRGPSIAVDYPNPEVFAAVRTFHAGVAWDRRNGAQCGMGAAFGRSKASLDSESGEGAALRDSLVSADDTASVVQRHLEAEALRLELATNLDPRTARWVWDVKALGMKVAEVARRDGVRREDVSRAVSRGVGELQRVLGPFVGG